MRARVFVTLRLPVEQAEWIWNSALAQYYEKAAAKRAGQSASILSTREQGRSRKPGGRRLNGT